MNYNEEGLLNLKKEIEQNYNIKLKFTKDFFDFPNFINEKEYKNIIFEEISENFKKVMMKNIEYNNFLKMNENGEISIEKDEKIGSESLIWYVTIINSEITFFSNNFYLNMDKSNLIGSKYMIIWKYENKEDKYLFYFNKKENTLTIKNNKAIIKKSKNKKNQLFKLIEIKR